MNVLVLGPQGSGKGTQAARIATAFGIPHVATGDMFRAAIAARTELGVQVEAILTSGELVPDDVTVALIRDRLAAADAADGFVLDGFPRNAAQANALDAMLEQEGRVLDVILFFEVDDDVVTARMLSRAAAEGRPDDTPEVIARRLELYHEQTAPVIDLYRATGRLVEIDAARSIDDVFTQIEAALGAAGGAL